VNFDDVLVEDVNFADTKQGQVLDDFVADGARADDDDPLTAHQVLIEPRDLGVPLVPVSAHERARDRAD
jgi:hypothetical protein